MPVSVPGQTLQLGAFVLDLGAEQLRDSRGRPVAIRSQALAVLRLLARRRGQLVTKDELMAEVWSGVVVTDDSIVQAIVDVRRALDEAGPRLVRTVPRRGYMLIADAAADAEPAATAERLAAAPEPAVAVLPFGAPEGGDPLLAHGMALELVLELGRNADLRVISHHSSFEAASQGHLRPPELSARLHARYLVDGSVVRNGERLRVGVELIDGQEDRIVWTARHEVDGVGVPALRDELVRRIAGSVVAKLRSSEYRRVLERPPKSLDSYEMATRAFALMLRFDTTAAREARALLERATAEDPHGARGWTYLANLDMIDVIMRITGERRQRHLPDCLAHLRRALAIDPELPITWRVLGFTYSAAGDFGHALAAAQRSVELAPSDANNLAFLAKAQLEIGSIESALEAVRKALDMFPLVPPWVRQTHAQVLWACGALDDALTTVDACLAEMPQYWPARSLRMTVLVELGRLDEACHDAALLRRHWPRLTWSIESQFAPGPGDALRQRSLAAARAAGLQPD